MATTFTWTITAIECVLNQEGTANVVSNVHWTCLGVDGTHTANVSGTCGLGFSGGAFTPYEQLTQDQVFGWVWTSGSVNKEVVEASVEYQIQDIINPAVATLPLPWQN